MVSRFGPAAWPQQSSARAAWVGIGPFGLLLFGLLLFASGSAAGRTVDNRHPMDGPDAELRLMRTQAGFRLALRVNLAWLDEEFDEPRELRDEVSPEDREALRDLFAEWVSEQDLLRLDEQALRGALEESAWTDADPERIPYYPRNGARALTYLDAWFVYAAPNDLESVYVHWPSYPANPVLAGGPVGAPLPADAPRIEVKAVLLAGPEERVETLNAERPEVRWRLPQTSGADHLLPLPAGPLSPAGLGPLWGAALGVLVLAGWAFRRQPLRLGLAWGTLALAVWAWYGTGKANGPWDEAAAEELLSTLHRNLYRAFDFHEKPDVYTALERSVHGDLLQSLYEQIHATLILEEEGGALCRVETITPLARSVAPGGRSDVAAEDRFRGTLHWQVDGILHHWGHSHRRRQEMKADFEVGRVAQGWRLLTATITESKRLPVAQDGLEGVPARPQQEGPQQGEAF